MHSCLNIPDIFYQICDYVRLRKGLPRPQSDLASLARTCRAFKIALDSLWYEIDGIGPLIRCMPRDLWEIDVDRCLFLKRPLKSSDIHILHEYARRVRSFRSDYSPWHKLPYRALPSHSCGHGPGRLLPRLEQLVWHVDNIEAFPHLHIFLSPTLKTLSITFDVRHKEQLSFLATIPACSPTISKLTIGLRYYDIFPSNNSLVEGFSDALQTWDNLSELEIFRAPLDGLLCAAQMPKLKRLSIHLVKVSERSLLPDFLNSRLDSPHDFQYFYPALESLVLSSVPCVTIAIQFFKMLQSTKLSTLELGFVAPDASLDNFRRFFNILAEQRNLSSLKVFQFTCWHPQFFFADIVLPLLVFPELKEVRLRLASPMEFSEEQMSQVASSWPHLEVLEAMGIAPIAPASRLQTTLSCLVHLASGCPKLRELCLWVNASDGATRSALRADPGRIKGVQNWALRRLDVQNSPISHKEFVASFLSDIFPNLEDITPKFYGSNKKDNAGSRNIRRWQYVAQVLLPMLSRALTRDYERLGSARPQTYDLDSSFGYSARWQAKRVEEEDGEWSDPGQLIVKGPVHSRR